MSVWHGDLDKKKPSGGRKRRCRGKRRFERGGFPTETLVGERRTKTDRRRGGNVKIRLLSEKWINVSDPATGQTKRVEVEEVLRNPSNVDYDRRGVVTKGTLVRTSLGTVRVMSRPGQSGILNGIIAPK